MYISIYVYLSSHHRESWHKPIIITVNVYWYSFGRTYNHLHVNAPVFMWTYVYTHIPTHACIDFVYMCVYIHTCIHMLTLSCTCYAYTCMCMYVHICMHTQIHTRTHAGAKFLSLLLGGKKWKWKNAKRPFAVCGKDQNINLFTYG